MIIVTSTITDAQKQVVDFVRQGQETAVQAVASWTEQASKLVPDLSGMPFGTLYGNPQEIVDGTFEFAQQLLGAQHDFVVGLIDASGVNQIGAKAAGSKSSK